MKSKELLVIGLVVMMSLQTVVFLLRTTAWAESPPPIICQKIFDDPEVVDIAVDSNGSTIVVARDEIAKYDSECNEMWPEPIEYPLYGRFYGIAVDSDDNIILAGRDDSIDVLIVKYTADGVMLWDESYDFDSYKDTAYAVAVDSNDNIIAVGGSDQTEAPWNERWIVLKCNSNGTELCRDVYTYNSPDPYENAEALDVAIDSNDNIVVTGKSKVYGGMYPDYQMLTIKYDSDCDGASLDRIWVREYGTKDPSYGEYNRGNTVTIDSEDNIIVGGEAESTLDKEAVKYSPVGTIDWSWDGPDIVASAVTSIDEIIVASEDEIYKLTPDLDEVWNLLYITGYEITGVAVDSTDNIIVGGHSSTKGCIVKYSSPVPNISVSPMVVDFGNVNVGSISDPETVNISNRGIVDLSIGQIISTGDDPEEFNIRNDNCSNQVIPPDLNCTLEVTCSPSSEGSKNAKLRISSNDPDIPFLDVPLIVEGVDFCECDISNDGKCDMEDWLLFGVGWGRTDCNVPGLDPCECDLNNDGRCDMEDWLMFGEDWGRTDCP